MICAHHNQIPKGIKRNRNNKWQAVCGSCLSDKSFAFGDLDNIMKQTQNFLQTLLQNFLCLFSQYKSTIFITLNSLYDIQNNRSKDVQFNVNQLQILQNNCSNLNEIISKQIIYKLSILTLEIQQIKNKTKTTSNFRVSELLCNALEQTTTQIPNTSIKKPIQMIPIKFVQLPLSYPQPKIQ